MEFFRPAHEAELRSVYEVFYQNEFLDNPHLPSPGDIPPYFSHVLHTGTLYVAEQDGRIVAFAGVITRGNVSFLTDLFVLPSYQSGQLGKKLLRSVLPEDNRIHCTLSSSDPRALALYIRAGMLPQWPHFALQLDKSTHVWSLAPDMEIIEADSADTACVLAAVYWAAQRATVLHIDVPGPHPGLAILLEGGFHIISFDTFVSTAITPFFDARCYIASGGDML
jgi:GNAT superfamily N-acetyltransferase